MHAYYLPTTLFHRRRGIRRLIAARQVTSLVPAPSSLAAPSPAGEPSAAKLGDADDDPAESAAGANATDKKKPMTAEELNEALGRASSSPVALPSLSVPPNIVTQVLLEAKAKIPNRGVGGGCAKNQGVLLQKLQHAHPVSSRAMLFHACAHCTIVDAESQCMVPIRVKDKDGNPVYTVMARYHILKSALIGGASLKTHYTSLESISFNNMIARAANVTMKKQYVHVSRIEACQYASCINPLHILIENPADTNSATGQMSKARKTADMKAIKDDCEPITSPFPLNSVERAFIKCVHDARR